MSLVNTTDVGSSATVPDAGATTKWKDYIWVRRLGAAGEAKFYIWNENATSDATYLKWQEKSDVVVSDIPMTEGQMLVGGTGNVGTAVALSGHAEVTKTGDVTVNAVAADKITNAMVKSDAAIASTKLAEIPYSKVALTGAVLNADLAGSIANDKLVAIANDKLAGSISQDKLAGSIPFSKLSLNDADIPFGKIDKIFEKNIDVQGSISTATGNFPEYTTPTGIAVPQVDGSGTEAVPIGPIDESGWSKTATSGAWEASQTHAAFTQYSTTGSGSSASFSVVTDSGGIPTFTWVSGGTGYVIGEALTFRDPFTSGNSSPTAVLLIGADGLQRRSLVGIYRAIVTSGSSPSTITLPDPSSGTYDGQIFKLSVYRANTTTNKGPVYLRTAGKAVNSGQCTANDVQLTLAAGHGFVTGDKISVLGVFDDNGRDYGASDVAVTVTTNVIEYELPKVDITSINHGTIAGITNLIPTCTTTHSSPGTWFGDGFVTQTSTTGNGTGAIFSVVGTGDSTPTFTLVNGGTGYAAGDDIVITEPNATNPETATLDVATIAATATVTTAYPHPFKTGDKVNISGATGGNAGAYNASFSSITRTSNTTFSISLATPQTAAAGTLKVSRTGGNTGGLVNFTSQRGVVVKANKLVDNAAGVLSDVMEIIPETNDPWAKKVVLDVCCDSRNSGDGQWLISGHGGDRQKFSKTGTRLEVSAGEVAIGATGNLTFVILANKPKAGDVFTFENGAFEVITDTASNSNVVEGKNTGESVVGGDGVKFVTQSPPLSNSAEFITSLGGSSVFFDPKTGQIIMPTIDWKPRSSSPYRNNTP